MRKTTPTLRVLEKHAVAAGGATNHRIGPDDAILIKDNHLRLACGVAAAVARCRASRPDLRLEIEAQSLEQFDEALAAGADIVLVDNMPLDEVRGAVRRAAGRIKIEIRAASPFTGSPNWRRPAPDGRRLGRRAHALGSGHRHQLRDSS